ncbi:MAG: SPOR domain-containing protein [Myxococcales bacterium]|nr:SPOR domain-containing protein [Myxococcales bacterium]
MANRDPELYKDKVEVSLDGRQIFYLFFGGSVIVGIVFVLGVLVGRRVEARGHVDRARTHTAQDPLAALDRLEGSGGLSFQGALTGKDAPAPVEKKVDAIAKERAATPPAAKADAKPDPKTEAKPEAKAEVKAEAKIEKKAEPASGPVVKPEPDRKADDRKDEDRKAEDRKAEAKKAEAKKAEDKKAEDKKTEDRKTEDKPAEDRPAKKADKATDVEAKAEPRPEEKRVEEKKPRYTLQLSSFQDRAEAEAFLASVKAQGFSARITQAEVEGKGTFYRVRTGTYGSMDAANEAKAELEKAGKSASVMKL